jgi:hypothetical protein
MHPSHHGFVVPNKVNEPKFWQLYHVVAVIVVCLPCVDVYVACGHTASASTQLTHKPSIQNTHLALYFMLGPGIGTDSLNTLLPVPLCACVPGAAMLGHLGTQQLGAVSLANLAVSFAIYVFSFLVFLTTPRIAAAHVAGDKDAVSRLAGVGLWLAGGCGLVTTLGVMLLAGPIVQGALVVQASDKQTAMQRVNQQQPAAASSSTVCM